jgi:hypothetical protein
MASPAASSAALLMRKPVDKRSMVVACNLLILLREAWAVKALVFVLITVMMFLLKMHHRGLPRLRTVLLIANDSSVRKKSLIKF